MIIGTAGHIDHGKTTLVRALTGVDTDRLPQEKERGISIEPGYAYETLADGHVLAYVDVPGHERLVRAMAAGACGIDFALLVVAADDGIMPQTREHVAILDLLGVCRGAVALTKTDRVDSPRLGQVESDVIALLAPTGLSAAPVFALNAAVDADPGLAALRRHLHEAAADCAPRDSAGLFRMAVDRVFTVAGHGTVVTGTVFAGCVAPGDTVTVMPASLPARVRGVHAQNRPSMRARAGERCALNVAGVDRSRMSRGDWLADARALGAARRMDARLRLLTESNLRIAQGTPMHVHLATAHQVARVFPLDLSELQAGQAARVQLVFQELACALPGDRFIARDAQAARTVGGGVILDPCAPARGRRAPERLRWLEALERSIAGAGVAPLLERAPYGVTMSALVRWTGRPPQSIALPKEALVVPAEQETFVLPRSRWDALRERTGAALRRFHDEAPDEPGPDAGRLRRIALPDMPRALWDALVDALVLDGALRRSGPWLQAPEHEVALTERDRELAERLQALISSGRYDPPWVRDLAGAVGEPDERVREVLRKQVRQGRVFQVVRDLFYDSGCIGELAEIAAALAQEQGAVHAARYRDAIGLGRKRAIQILEFFDRIGYTRRVRHVHVLREDSQMACRIRKAHAPGGAAGLQTRTGASDASR